MNKKLGKLVYIILGAAIIAALQWSCSRPSHDKAGVESGYQNERPESGRAGSGIQAAPGLKGRFGGGGPAGRGLGRQRSLLNAGIIVLSEQEKQAVEIRTARVTPRKMRSQLRAMGKVIVPQLRKAIVSYAFPARVAEIHVAAGDWVKAGQKLVTLQSEAVGTARADFLKASADLDLARRNLEREKSLFERGVSARKSLLAAETEFKVAETNLDAAEKKLHVLGFDEEQIAQIAKSHQVNPVISLYAPIDGKVIQSSAVLGQMVDQNTEILTIIDPTVLWVEAEVYERDIARVRIGQEAGISVPAYPGETFPGRISFISDVLKEESRTITVRTDVDNRQQKLKAGMFADMVIYLDDPAAVPALPQEAVLDEGDSKIVFVCVNGGYRPQVVEVGAKEGGFVEIRSGLEAGAEVVTEGNYQLKSKMYQDVLRQAGVH
jgi:cobalt-zinc-cadmium efflux system membrane fusion protein